MQILQVILPALIAGCLWGQTAREWNERGLTHSDRQEWIQAESAFRKGLQESKTPDETLTLASNLAFLHLQTGRTGHAARLAPTLERALSEAEPGAPAAMGLGCLGVIYWRGGRVEDSVPMFERSIRMWTDIGQPHQDLPARNNLAASLYDAGRVEEADRVLEGLAATEGPEHPSILANMAILHAHHGRLSEAAKAFEAALGCPFHNGLDPGHRAEIRMRYAAVLRRIGQKQEAKRRHQEADALLREAKASAFTDHRVDWRDLAGKR